MHYSLPLILPFLLPFSLARPQRLSPQELYDLPSRDISHGAARHRGAKRVAGDLTVGHDLKRIVRKKKRGACPAKSSPSSSGTTTTGGTDANASLPMTTSPSTVTSSSTSSETSSSSTTSATSPSTATGSAAASSSASVAGNSTMDWLFPLSAENSWTTFTGASGALSFTSALKPLTAGSLPASSTAPDGSAALIANYPANTFSLNTASNIGFSFYTEGQHNNVNVEGAKEVLFSYSAFFPDGFNFVKGGKMPGLYGGTSLSEAQSCSGGRQNGRDECFSARLMWRTNGMGEFYNYYPTSINQGNGYCTTPPMSVCDTACGDSIGRGSFSWSTGKWTTVAQRIRLNDVGQSNGEQQLWVDGVPILNLTGLQIMVKESKIYGIMAQTFFGGSDSTWDSPTDQNAWFKDWSLAVIA